MKIDIFDLKSKKTGTVELDDAVFGAEVREHLFYEVINWQRARRRAGTHKTKGRSEVRGGGKKPFK
jgi:large subunit ribosomal protein L4